MFVDGGSINKDFVQEGTVVFKEGDAGDAAYIVESGSVGIFKTVEGEEVRLAVITEGELFGEMSIIDGSKRMAHAVAMEDSVIVSVPRAGLDTMLAKQEPFIKTLIQILADNLRNVHEIYIKRPRSLRDHLSAIGFHIGGFRAALKHNPDADTSGDAMRRIDEIDAHVTAIRSLVSGWKDPRDNVFGGAAGKAKKPDDTPASGSA